MKGARYVIKVQGVLSIVSFDEINTFTENGFEYSIIGKLEPLRTMTKQDYLLDKRRNNPKKKTKLIYKDKVLKLVSKHIDLIANKGKENCLKNFKQLVYNRL